MSFRSMRLALVALVGLASASALTGCGGGGGNAGAGNPQLVQMLTSSVPTGTTGVPYTAQFLANFPHAPGRFLVTGGALPPGLALDNQTGLLTGYPRQTGVFTFQIAARDGTDGDLPPGRDANFAQDTGNFQLQILLGPPNILPQQPPAAQYRASYGYQIDVAGGTAPYIFQLVSAPSTLPTGLSISSSGLLGNFPQQETPDGSPYVFDVRVTDANGIQDTETLSVDVVVLPLLILTTSPLPQAAALFPYSITLQLASSGAGAPITWTQLLPLGPGETNLASIGMELTTGGILRNAAPNPGPTSVGTFLFTARVTDEAAQVKTRQYSLQVNAGPVVNSISPNKAVGAPPFVVAGLNFQPGAAIIFKPGPNQVQVNPNTNTPTQLTLSSTPPTPAGGGGFVTVRVLNPDGGFADLPNAFAFPAANLTFSTTATLPSPQSSLASTGLAAGDINKDGFGDFVHCGSQGSGFWGNAQPTSGGVHLMLNTPAAGVFNGTFNQVQLNTGGDFQGVKLVDVDVDGDLDIVALGRIGGSIRIRTWLNPYPAAYTAATPSTDTFGVLDTGGHSSGMDLGRVSPSDGVPDVVYSMGTGPGPGSSTSAWGGGAVQSQQGAGNGTFNSSIQTVNFIAGFYQVSDVTSADFDNDGRSDTFVGDHGGGYMYYNGWGGTLGQTGAMALTNSSSGVFGAWTPLSRGGGVIATVGVASGDVNGDGNQDILASTNDAWNGFGGTTGLGVFQGSGSGSFSSVVPSSISGRPRYSTVFDADFDFPGDVAVSIADNKIDIFKGRTGSLGLLFRQTITVTGSPRMGRMANADFNGDGRTDICGAMSFFVDSPFGSMTNANDRGAGSPTGVVIYLNTSN